MNWKFIKLFKIIIIFSLFYKNRDERICVFSFYKKYEDYKSWLV